MIRPFPAFSRFASFAAAALVAGLLLSLAPSSARADEDDEVAVEDDGFVAWEARMADFFASNPELKDQKGSGWKPYNRAKWFYEERMDENKEIPIGARWNAFVNKRRLETRNKSQATATWFSLGPTNLAGRILALEFDPNDANILYAGGADGGIWKSTDGGVSWVALDDELPTLAVNAIAVLPSNSDIVLIGTGEATNNIDAVKGVGILRSTDAGLTWGTTSLNLSVTSGHGFHAMEVNPFTGTVIAAASDGLWRSSDDGQNWTPVRSDGNYTDVVCKPGSADTIYCVKGSDIAASNGVRMSADDGLTWPKRSSGLPLGVNIGKSKLAVTPANSEYVYVVIVDNNSNGLEGVYRSTNGATSWTQQSDATPNLVGGQGWYNLSLSADPNDVDRIIMGGTPLNRSVNGGVSFSGIGSGVHVDHHAIAYRPGTTDNVFVGTDGGVWESTNDGTNWIDRNTGLVTYQFYDICVSQADPLLSFGGTQDQGTDKWTGTTTWAQGLGADGMVCNCDATNALRVYGEIQFGEHYVSTAGGSSGTWFEIQGGITGNGDWVTAVDLDQNNGLRLYTTTNDGIFRTLDGGINWVNVDANGVRWISISPVVGGPVWTLPGNVPRYTTDDGASWNNAQPYGFATGTTATKILAHPTDPNAAFVTFSTYNAVAHIARTTDLGATWQDMTGDFVPQPVNAIAVDPQNTTHWFIGTDVGVWATSTEGQAWVPFETGFPNAVVADLEIQNSSRKLRAGTHGRGMWEVDITSPSTGVGPAVAQSIDLMLDNAYPNPVSDGTVLRYAARKPGNVRLAIYDVQGRLVTELADHSADGVIRQVRWEPNGVADGVYFARLTSGSDEKARKLIVIR